MHIVNAMFGRSLGGIEQSFLDYCTAISAQGNQVTALIHPKAAIKTNLIQISNKIEIKMIGNQGLWDIFAILKIRRFLKKINSDVIITHGNRASSLLKKAAKGIAPVVGVAHNYSISRLADLDAAFTITKDLQKLVTDTGQKNTYHIPNMIDLHDININHETHNPPVIGAMGRFVKKKGFESLLLSLAKLRDSGAEFKAIIGGEGQEEKNLRELSNELGLEELVTFLGWVEDKERFYNSIDIFCLPSLHEPFGIVLLEALSHMIPTVTTDTEGPSEIVTNGYDALMVKKDNPEAMEAALNTLVNDKQKGAEIAANGLQTVKEKYEISVVGKQIQSALEEITSRY